MTSQPCRNCKERKCPKTGNIFTGIIKPCDSMTSIARIIFSSGDERKVRQAADVLAVYGLKIALY